MAREDIGTKSTRADIIDILKSRNYIYSHENGYNRSYVTWNSCHRVVGEICLEIISTRFTRNYGRSIRDIEAGQENYASVIKYAVNSLIESLILL